MNSWPVCPPGHHLAIPQPPMCAKCPPTTHAVAYTPDERAIYAKADSSDGFTGPFTYLCESCPSGTYQSEPGKTACVDCSYHVGFALADEAFSRSNLKQPEMQIRRFKTVPLGGVRTRNFKWGVAIVYAFRNELYCSRREPGIFAYLTLRFRLSHTIVTRLAGVLDGY